MTYFRTAARRHYHRRGAVSLPSSAWDRVVPARYGRQANRFRRRRRSGGGAGSGKLPCAADALAWACAPFVWVLYGQAARAISTG